MTDEERNPLSERPPSRSDEEWSPAKRTLGCLVALVVVVGIPAAGIYAFVQWINQPVHQVAEDVRDYETLCNGREIPGAAGYTPGDGPHPVAVFESVRTSEDTPSQVSLDLGKQGSPFNPDDPASVRLVACAERTGTGDVVASCEFTSENVDMRSATAEITVYEAKTGDQVGEPVEVVGEDESCPGIVSFKGTLSLYTVPSETQFLAALEPFVSD